MTQKQILILAAVAWFVWHHKKKGGCTCGGTSTATVAATVASSLPGDPTQTWQPGGWTS